LTAGPADNGLLQNIYTIVWPHRRLHCYKLWPHTDSL